MSKHYRIETPINKYVNELYKDFSGFDDLAGDDCPKLRKDKIYTTYGEIQTRGINTLLKEMELDENDVFYDFGSGIGKMTVQMFLNTPIRGAIGIEAYKPRCDDSKRIAKQLKKEFPEAFEGNRQLHFKQGNFLKENLKDATIMYTCSTCFSQKLLRDIGTRVNHAPKMRYVISLVEIPNIGLKYQQRLFIKCGWEKRTECFLYSAD